MHSVYFYYLVLLIISGVSAGRGNNRDRNGTRNAGRNRDERALNSFMQRVVLGKALSCHSDADCGARGGNKCVSDTLQFCGRPAVADIFKEADRKQCTGDSDCQATVGAKNLAYRCSKEKCALCGPSVCQTDSDCCTSGHGKPQKCAILSGYPEKRCWDACSSKNDCHNAMGLGNMKIACLEGVCQKRNRERKGKVSP